MNSSLEEHLREVVQYSLQKPPEEMLAECLNLLIRISGATGGSILGEEGAGLKFLYSDQTDLIGKPVPWESIAGDTATRNVIVYTYALTDKRHYDGVDQELAKQTHYLLSMPIPSIHNASTRTGEMPHTAGALQLLFDRNIFPDLDVEDTPIEFSLEEIKGQNFYVQALQEIFVILSNISLGMEIRKLRQTSYQAIHELKNKLISARAWVNCLREDLGQLAPDALTDEDIQEDFKLAEDAVASGASLAVSYLQFTRIYTPNIESVQVNDVVREAARDIQAFADDFGGDGAVAVSTDLSADIPVGQHDPAQLKMAFFNLGKNAAEALVTHGVPDAAVKLETAWENERVTVRVSDNGKGMPPEIADNLFVPFKTKKAGGTGLGLTITKKIVDVHRGAIRCNTGPDGTVFTILL